MVNIVADEFLTDERDRKYYADHYTCCPPPLFIIIITLVEVITDTSGVALFIATYKTPLLLPYTLTHASDGARHSCERKFNF
jgi:hypothetical protein